ncbi:universal stress protein [Salinilacihabitans rarus]|uniref:universal stress protein n=1 Tax=Salinilacihabitans rarus TaxID=2961596 RepID=UPI0020C8CE18|nr:universal stress protein [Salinilacihabitans rarus]
MHYLVGTDSVHATAAVCDYLAERATAADAVTVVGLAPPDDPGPRRDAEDALNVARGRLGGVGDLATDVRTGDPAAAVLEAAAERDPDEVVVPGPGGPDEAGADGALAAAVVAEADRPVVVAPAPDR